MSVAQRPRSVDEQRTVIRQPASFGRVAVVFGGRSSERAVSLDTGRAVLDALQSRGVDAIGFDPAEHPLSQLRDAGVERVWIAMHGPGGEDGALQGALEWLDIPYTGSGVLASALAMDKVRSKHVFAQAGIPTPAYEVVRDGGNAAVAAERLGFPLFVKPAAQGSSVGMSKVLDAGELRAAIGRALEFGTEVLLERCVVGKELTVAVLNGVALPSIRIETPRVFYDYRAKYESERTEYFCPGTDGSEDEARYASLALDAFAALGLRGWGRIDFMAGADDEPQVIEANTVPGMTSHSLVPMAAAAAGMDFAELCWRILETSVAESDFGSSEKEVANGA